MILNLKSLYDFLAEVTPLGKLFFHVLVNDDVSVQVVDFQLHLVVVCKQLLSVLRLVLQLICQLRVLVDR